MAFRDAAHIFQRLRNGTVPDRGLAERQQIGALALQMFGEGGRGVGCYLVGGGFLHWCTPST